MEPKKRRIRLPLYEHIPVDEPIAGIWLPLFASCVVV
jgi:hypothetical protein